MSPRRTNASPRPERRAPARALPLFVLAAALASGCLAPKGNSDPGQEIRLDEWKREKLDCSQDLCRHEYVFRQTQSGEMRVQVYAPKGEGQPDFGVMVRNAQGRILGESTRPMQRPRRIDFEAPPGEYRILVYGIGPVRSATMFDLNLARRGSRPPLPPPPPPPVTPAQESTPAPVPPPVVEPAATRSIEASVLALEDDGAGRSFVLLDKGSPDGVAVGMQGSLLDGDTVQTSIEIVEVFRDGSRAELTGTFDGEVSIDARAVLSVQP